MRIASKIIIALLLIAAAVLAALAWYNREPATAPSASPSSSAQVSVSPRATTVKVFFSKHPESDNDPSKTFAVDRTTRDSGVGKFAVAQLLAGPTTSESAAGYFTPGLDLSGASDCGGQDFSLNISGGKATLQFCRASSLRGVVADGQLESELKDTLLQFPSVQKAVILNVQGDCLFNASGMNLCKQ